MSAKDEELQKAAEQGRAFDADNMDEKAYREVFRILKKDPEYELSAHFAERVVASIATKQTSRSYRDYIWFGAGIMVLLAAFVGTMMYTGLDFNLRGIGVDLGFLSGMSDYKGLAIFGVVFIALLNWLDKRLVRHDAGSI